MYERFRFKVSNEVHGVRVDQFVCSRVNLLTRSQLRQRLVSVRINGTEVKISKRILVGDNIELVLRKVEVATIKPENIKLHIIYEDENIVVINKRNGLMVHPTNSCTKGTIVNALLYHYPSLPDIFSDFVRPGIVHRLDKDTSGVMIIAKNVQAKDYLSSQFKNRTVKKTYLAWVAGILVPNSGTIQEKIERDSKVPTRYRVSKSKGKESKTNYKVIKINQGNSFVELSPITGRTHQLRVHMRWLGHPVLGDVLYAGRLRGISQRLLLHSSKLTICLPGEVKEKIFEAELPIEFDLQ